MHALRSVTLAVFCVTLAACSSGTQRQDAPASPSALPMGAVGEQIANGRQLMMRTRELMPGNVGAHLSCDACHLTGGTTPRGGSLVGTYARFPQWNKRAQRVITLQDRIAECFLYSMNGTPPAYESKEMVALVSYIAWLSRGTPVLAPADRKLSFMAPLPSATPNVAHGAQLYAQSCALCHGANGAGNGAIPPLWGAASFNDKAGMAHADRMTGFIHYNMPKNAPGSLSMTDAYDVAAFVLSHPRPRFDANKPVAHGPIPARYF